MGKTTGAQQNHELVNKMDHHWDKKIIGVDLGGTNARAGVLEDGQLVATSAIKIDANGQVHEVLANLYEVIEHHDLSGVTGIGIGVPSVVDTHQGIVYDVQNIPSWEEVPIKQILEERYGLPVRVNNDANCMALAEHYFGMGVDYDDIIGLVIGTGIAAGIIINGKLYEGANCGAGEIGMLSYLDQHFEHYCSGQFFENVYHTPGEEVYAKAMKGDAKSKDIFNEFGHHLGHAISATLFAYDPQIIVLAGALGQACHLYKKSVWHTLSEFPYQQSVKNLRIEASQLTNPGILGAAALFV